MAATTPVTEVLQAAGVAHRLHIHLDRPRSLEQAARERGLTTGRIVRSLLFLSEAGEFVLVLMAGPGRVSWPKLRRYLGVTRLTTATAAEVRGVTGYPPGAVSPFGLVGPIRLLADQGLMSEETTSVGAGVPNAGVILCRKDLVQLLAPEIGDFSDRPGQHSSGVLRG